jgi:Mrp family chromosome partitioning ATPase
MDRIRKALDLAREERNSSTRPTDYASRASTSKVAARFPTAIQYTKTRTFTPPESLLESNRIISPSSADPVAQAFRMLRTQVLQRLDEHGWRSLAILSPCKADGKTTLAINLAISLAGDHRHTALVVDFDMKQPSVGEKLGLSAEMGADDVLCGGARLEDCLYHPDGFDRLVILPTRAPMGNSSEALAGPRCRELVAELRSRYPDRILIFDLPPVLVADDALAFLPLVECGLVVAAEGSTRREDLLRCMELLRKTPIVGTVLNRATAATSGPG